METAPRSLELGKGPAEGRPSANPFRVLGRHRNFRIFWTGQTLSLNGGLYMTS
jgi:hypothetical protein